MGFVSRDEGTLEVRNRTQVTSFGVCAAREEPPVWRDHNVGNNPADDERFAVCMISMTFSTTV
jgi:hypothetical protein